MQGENPRPNPKANFKKWLEALQQQSWELELLISGFSIYLLVQAGDPLKEYLQYIDYHFSGSIYLAAVHILIGVISLGRTFLIFNLILHVLLRGLWIATIGLRYVSGNIDIESLRYSERFTRYLQRKIPDFDDYIQGLEKICSVIFAFTFVIIFCALSAGLFLIYFILFSYFFSLWINNTLGSMLSDLASILVAVFFTFFMGTLLVYFFDFVTFGKVKKSESLSVVYLPVYKVLSILSLSFLYRPLIYNMIDNRFGRKVGYLLVPYIAAGILVTSLNVELSFFKPFDYSGPAGIETDHYDDVLAQTGEKMVRVTLPSKYADGRFLEVFFQIRPKTDERTMGYICPDFEPFRKSGLLSNMFTFRINGNRLGDSASSPEDGIDCWGRLYGIRLDSLDVSGGISYHFYHHPQHKVDGILGMLDISEVPGGKHMLHIEKYVLPDNPFSRDQGEEPTIDTLSYSRILFWKE